MRHLRASLLLLWIIPAASFAQSRAIHLVKGDWGDSSWKVPAVFTAAPNSSLKISLKESCLVQLSWNAEVRTGFPDINPVESGVQFKLFINGTPIERVKTAAGSWGSSTSSAVLTLTQQFPAGDYTVEVRAKGSSQFPSYIASRHMTLTAFRASQVDGL